jgi:hypothetical protein
MAIEIAWDDYWFELERRGAVNMTYSVCWAKPRPLAVDESLGNSREGWSCTADSTHSVSKMVRSRVI